MRKLENYEKEGEKTGFACNALLNSTSDIPSLGPSLKFRAISGLTDLKRLYKEQSPHRAMVLFLLSAL